MRRVILFALLTFSLSRIESARNAVYSVTRNVQRDLLAQHTDFFSAAALNVSSSEESTEVTYIEDKCSWIRRTTGDCCYAEGTMSCVDHNLYPIFKDCQDAFDQGERNSGGIYFLRPEPTWRLIRAVCMFDSQSGWTVIQRRLDGSVDFFRGWDDYVDGFGDLNGEYWIGLDNIYYLTRENQKLSIYLEAHDGESRIANYSTFYIDDESADYVNHLGGYTGDAGNAWNRHNGMKFSTFDNDNDILSGNCAAALKGGWWYRNCLDCNLNGVWYDNGIATQANSGILWSPWVGGANSCKITYMKIGR